MRADTTGKISLDHIYTQPDPRPYFTTLRDLDYHIPTHAKPHFSRIIDEYRRARGVSRPTVLDIGCSYGINAVLLRCDTTMEELYERYCDPQALALSRGELQARDRDLMRLRGRRTSPRFVGLDSSHQALSYALGAGFIDGAVHADLERTTATDRQRAQLAEADLVISTGCLGYVGERTLWQVATARDEHRPWMAHFVLRMFPFEPIAERLAEAGYRTVRHEGLFRQRRFATAAEQESVLQRLAEVGVDSRGLEEEGWFYAQLYLSRPAD
ncbi:hypothetical protein [Thermomonospora curvata]|uniref:Methyltransferase type 12 n=1 Tax=Thermomonospora curvata (strain ATCC 19995 / DSM 43183 / JCM 3096 / KCTC 9072 / NBRC 15933 / NCIMB 10081 / Henssen B9) TaxID=471852 RepID=D1ADN9_THECD|nr:hypothetical protein [Thermomonospora curvata]ACY97499.1 conserved hypothetical protein [Thermomonospora curvata DSM 43183]